MSWYTLFRLTGKWSARALTRMEVSGTSNIPRHGPFFLVANHLSTLDPLMVQGHCPRRVHFFTKSTQFTASRAFHWFLTNVSAIPARRYRVDTQAVRTALRVLEQGDGVGIYLEGERSWDGTLQPFRRGAVRLLLKPGVPVIPCGVAGSYEAWPRWTRRPRRVRVSLRYGAPIHFRVHDTRPERDRALDAATERLRAAISELTRPSGA